MGDDIDSTQDRLELEEKLRKKYTPKVEPLKSTGHCLYCNAELHDDRRWCDKDCMDDYEYYVNLRIK